MLSVEATGRNVEQAIENALFELKAPREDVDIKILDEGGFFRKARVLVSISPEEEEKYQKREALRNQPELKEDDANEPAPKQTLEEKLENEVDEDEEAKEEVAVLESKEDAKPEKNDAPQNDLKRAKEFLDGFLAKSTLTGSLEITETEDEIFANIIGYSDIIGYRGEGLNSLQYLANVIVQKHNRHAKRVRIDCDNYRQRREGSLIALAQRMAKKAERTHSSVKLEPMTANERRIIHTALADSETVETYSKGEEPHRYLIIKPKN